MKKRHFIFYTTIIMIENNDWLNWNFKKKLKKTSEEIKESKKKSILDNLKGNDKIENGYYKNFPGYDSLNEQQKEILSLIFKKNPDVIKNITSDILTLSTDKGIFNIPLQNTDITEASDGRIKGYYVKDISKKAEEIIKDKGLIVEKTYTWSEVKGYYMSINQWQPNRDDLKSLINVLPEESMEEFIQLMGINIHDKTLYTWRPLLKTNDENFNHMGSFWSIWLGVPIDDRNSWWVRFNSKSVDLDDAPHSALATARCITKEL